MCRRLLTLILTLLLYAESHSAESVDYIRDIKPILKSRCTSCHGSLKQESGLRLDTGFLIRKGGDGGSAVAAGNVKDSHLFQRITAEDESERMPPEGDPLTADQIDQIRRWIESGAKSPANEEPEADPRDHWSFKPIVRAPLPDIPIDGQIENEIDLFLKARRLTARIEPGPLARKHVLLRRVYFDLIGLPPTREELHAFLNNESPDAYDRVVDQLLNRPEYGERWGRHWMDVWRYSDWYGRRKVPDALNSYGQIWRWRDWIVRSMNEDKGYDRMILEMLAADEIAPLDDENLVATGFIVRNYYRWNYNTWMKDLVEHTGKAFLGVTLNCCHCHDHKYDPFTNEEYFAFRAFFEPIDIRQDRVPGEADPGIYPVYKLGRSLKPLKAGMVRIHDAKLDAKTFVYVKGESRDIIPDKPPVLPAVPAFLGGRALDIKPIELPPEAWYPGLKSFIRDEETQKIADQLASAQTQLAKAREALATAGDDKAAKQTATVALAAVEAQLAAHQADLAAIQARILADRVQFQGEAGNASELSRAANVAERNAVVVRARHDLASANKTLHDSRLKKSDDEKEAAKLKQAVAAAEKNVAARQAAVAKAEEALKANPTDYARLSPQYPKQSSGRRRALAQWIAARENPLTARVAANHLWRWHFGKPIVDSTENFGRNGDEPTHPDLINWLAAELMDNGWHMKPLHRKLVTSHSYRLSSNPADCPPGNSERDPDNRLLWRFNSHRVEAEIIRDSLLAVSDQLDTVMGGVELDENKGLTIPRRTLYFSTHGEGQMPWLQLFDAPSPVDCYQRTVSVRPQQALAMSNSELALKQARLLARSLHSEIAVDAAEESGGSTDQSTFIIAAFEQVLSRLPTEPELAASREYLLRQTDRFSSQELKPAADEPVAPSTDPATRARENFIHALFSHSDFVTVR